MFFCWQQFCYNFLEPAILNWIGRWGKFITDRAFIKHQATAFMHVFDQMSGHGNFSLTCLPDSHCYITGGPDCIEESESSAKLWRAWSSIWTGKRILLWRDSWLTIHWCIKGVVPLGMTSATARRHLKLRWSPASIITTLLKWLRNCFQVKQKLARYYFCLVDIFSSITTMAGEHVFLMSRSFISMIMLCSNLYRESLQNEANKNL